MTRQAPPRARVVAGATLALFLACFALLVFQLRTGRDPALGQGSTALARTTVPPPRRVLIRKTIIRKVIVHLPAEEDDSPPATVVPRSAPTTVRAAPAPAAPAPAAPAPAAPAPAPAPAPLTTHSS